MTGLWRRRVSKPPAVQPCLRPPARSSHRRYLNRCLNLQLKNPRFTCWFGFLTKCLFVNLSDRRSSVQQQLCSLSAPGSSSHSRRPYNIAVGCGRRGPHCSGPPAGAVGRTSAGRAGLGRSHPRGSHPEPVRVLSHGSGSAVVGRYRRR